MGKKGKKRVYVCDDDLLHLREVKWYRLRQAGSVFGAVVLVLGLILLVNHLGNDVLGIEHDRVSVLERENMALRDQMAAMTSNLRQFQTSIDSIDAVGSQLRLMVDLPPMDAETKKAGTGGALSQPQIGPVSDQTAEILASASSEILRLRGEIAVQQQSYRQVVKKAEYNKEYFAALPALKPMEGYYSRSGFGLRMHPVLGIFKSHEGLDIVNDVGTPVYASGNGTVEMAGQSGGGYGIVVVVNHGYGYQSLYAHLSKTFVREGQRVKRGDLIGKSGKTGLVSGPHLHYEVRHNGVAENPVNFFFDDITPQQYRSQLASR